MSLDIVLSLLQDGLTSGSIYALIAVALVMVFAVTRVIFVQAGEFISFGALTLFALEQGRTPLSLWFMVVGCVASAVLEVAARMRQRASAGAILRTAALWCGIPLVIVIATLVTSPAKLPMLARIALALAIVTPMGPAMYRLGYQRIAGASILVLLIVSVAVHFVMDGLALLAFGPDAARTAPFSDRQFDLGVISVSMQSLIVFAVAVVLVVLLFWFSRRTMYGCALRATASNRRGAALMGISADLAGRMSFGIGAFICAAAGVLIAPFVTIYYNSGFLISLKAFVGAVVGAMVSYPLAAGGALLIGVIESFAAFWSSAYKDVIVFGLMVPVLLWCSLLSHHMIDEEEDIAPASQGGSKSVLARWLARLAVVPLRVYALAALVVLVLIPFMLSPFYVTLFSYIYLYAIVTFGVVLLTGIAGQVSFGQAAFVGIGAYVSAALTTSCAAGGIVQRLLGGGVAQHLMGAGCALSPWFALPFSLLATALCAWVLGIVTLRMRGHYLPIATIAWAVAIFFFFANTDAIGGSSGITDIPGVSLLGDTAQGAARWLPHGTQMYYLILVAMIVCGVITANLLNSRTGRAIRALKSRSIMAESVGVDTAQLKIKVFLFAAIVAGVSGWLYAHTQRFVNPSPFSLTMGVEYIFMSVVGGTQQVLGALLGATTIRVLNDMLQNLLSGGLFGRSGNFEMIVFGVLIVVMLQRTQSGIAAIFTRWRAPRSVAVPAGGDPPARRARPDLDEPLLQVDTVSKRFGGLAAIDGVSFAIGAGEIVALIGPNGAGKSTMFNLITGVLPPTSGRIEFAGKRIDTLRCHGIARLGVARTFQHVKLLSDRTVLENVAIGAHQLGSAGMLRTLLRLDRHEERTLQQEAANQLRRVGLGDSLHMLAGSLPLGKQRIVEIARALAAEPALLLLDEPAAGLRFGEKKQLADLLRSLRAEGMSILLVEHDMAFVMELADRVVVQNFGRKIADGDPAAVQRDPLVRDAYLGVEA